MIRLPVTQPFPWRALLSYLEPRCIPNVERIEEQSYVRHGQCCVSYARDTLCIHVAPSANEKDCVAAAQRLFRPGLGTAPVDAQLALDPQLSTQTARTPGMRLPGSWSGFELAIRVVIGQQVTVSAARTLLVRWAERCGGTLTPSACLAANVEKLGMPQARVDTVLRVAGLAESIDFDDTAWTDLRPQLADLKGIGPWTLGYLDMRHGLLPDVFPAADAGLQIACAERNPKRLAVHAERWAPYRSFAAMRLWESLAAPGA